MSERVFNPDRHRPRATRLRIGVRGAAGTRKSSFAASAVDAGLGRVCYLDTEGKACHIPGSDGTRFDAFEIADPEDLGPAIAWALHDPQARAAGYGVYVLDSFAGWFQPVYAGFLAAKRAETGNPYAALDGADLQRLQVVVGEILRPLCVESRACVILTDTIAGKGLEEQADNEVGRIVPLTAAGLEYFVDVLVEVDLRLSGDGFSETAVHRVVKTNNRAFPIGLVLENPTFRTYLDLLGKDAGIPDAAQIAAEQADLAAPVLAVVPPAPPSPAELLAELLAFVAERGFTREHLVGAAVRYHQTPLLEKLEAEQIADLRERVAKAPTRNGAEERAAVPARAATGGRRAPASP
jgi:hypothetical protein